VKNWTGDFHAIYSMGWLSSGDCHPSSLRVRR